LGGEHWWMEYGEIFKTDSSRDLIMDDAIHDYSHDTAEHNFQEFHDP
jgi:hypothetical protein